jgi:hypothetical protein
MRRAKSVSLPERRSEIAMTESRSREPKRLEVTLSVSTEDQAQELHAAWLEIVSGKRTRISTAAEDTHEIMERRGTASRSS